MPGSDWRKHAKTGLIWTLGCLGLALAIWGLAFGLVEQGRYVEEANKAASEYSSNAAYEAYQPCRVSPVVQLDQCLANAERKYKLQRNDNRRDYADLIAQQRAALWASVMGIAAVIGMALSVVGVILVYNTFAATREANRIAQDNLRIYQHAERGFIRIVSAEVLKVDMSLWKYEVTLSFHNPGRSGATITKIMACRKPNNHWTWDKDKEFIEEVPRYVGADKTGDALLRIPDPDGHPTFLLIGIIEYTSLGLAGLKSYFTFSVDCSAGTPCKAEKCEVYRLPYPNASMPADP